MVEADYGLSLEHLAGQIAEVTRLRSGSVRNECATIILASGSPAVASLQQATRNQPAAVGTLAIGELARSTPDGYTIGQISESTQHRLYSVRIRLERKMAGTA